MPVHAVSNAPYDLAQPVAETLERSREGRPMLEIDGTPEPFAQMRDR